MRIAPDKVCAVVSMLCEGIGVRATERLTGLNRRTVLGVLEAAGAHCATLLDDKIRNVNVKQVEVDELYSFVNCRPENAEKNDPERGEFYCYLSLERHTKLVLNFRIGKRNGDNCFLLMRDLKQRVANRFQLSTDGYAGYAAGSCFGAVFDVFKHEIDYGMEVKQFGPIKEGQRRFNPPVCKWVRRTAKIGEPDLSTINTSRAERMNLSLRLFNRRFTRCTLGYSKTLDNHQHSMALLIAFYNFCRVHSAHGKTPAQASGLTDHQWTVRELLMSP